MFWFGMGHVLGGFAVMFFVVWVAMRFMRVRPFLFRPEIHETMISIWAIAVTLLASVGPLLLVSNLKLASYLAGVAAGVGLIVGLYMAQLLVYLYRRAKRDPNACLEV